MTDISKQHHQREEDLFLLNSSASLALGSDQQSCSKIRAFLKELWGTEALLLLTTGGSKAGTPEQTSCLIAPMREEPGVTPSLVFTFLLKLLTNKKKASHIFSKKMKRTIGWYGSACRLAVVSEPRPAVLVVVRVSVWSAATWLKVGQNSSLTTALRTVVPSPYSIGIISTSTKGMGLSGS